MDTEDEENPFCIQESFQEQLLDNVVAGKYLYILFVLSL